MPDFDWKDVVRKVAPTIGAALGGPFGGMATKIIADKFLGDENATEDQVAAAVQTASPAQWLELKKADQQFAVQMRELDIKLEQGYMQDTDNARRAHAADGRVFWLGVAILLTFAGTMGGILWVAYELLTEGMKITDPGIIAVVFTLLGTLLGYVATNAQQVVSYFFGSSKGSNDKTAALSQAVSSLGKKP